MLKISNVYKEYKIGSESYNILQDVSLEIKQGELVAVCGHSRSGKSTLLGIMSGLDAPTKGTVNYDGVNLYQLKEGELAQFRNRNFGIIFQNYNLIQDLTAYENVEVPLLLAKKKNRKMRNPSDLLEMVGLKDKIHTKVSLLSGGEQQRVSIARALIQEACAIFADEPTGALDYENSNMIIELLAMLKKELDVLYWSLTMFQ